MSHHDNNIEVRLGDKLVGWMCSISGAAMKGRREIVIGCEQTEVDKTFDLERMNRRICVPRETITSDVTNALVKARAELGRQCPGYAEIEERCEPVTNGIDLTATWKVIKVTPEKFEWLFEHEDFEAVDTEPDLEIEKIEITRQIMADATTFRSNLDLTEAWNSATTKTIAWRGNSPIAGIKVDGV